MTIAQEAKGEKMGLISADALKELIDGGFDLNFDEVPETKRELLRMIDDQPTVDAEPVRHGHWEFIGGYGYQYRCSVCNTCVERKSKYCQHCGAKMDGERRETDG